MPVQREERFLDDVFGIVKGQTASDDITENTLLELVEKTNDDGL